MKWTIEERQIALNFLAEVRENIAKLTQEENERAALLAKLDAGAELYRKITNPDLEFTEVVALSEKMSADFTLTDEGSKTRAGRVVGYAMMSVCASISLRVSEEFTRRFREDIVYHALNAMVEMAGKGEALSGLFGSQDFDGVLRAVIPDSTTPN